MKILLHVCCGTCVIGLLDFFKKDKLSLLFYNPNIEPEEEYRERLNAVRQVAQEFGLDLIEYQYENKTWHDKVKGLEKEPENGKRCLACFEMRLEKTAEMAKKFGFEAFATSLSVNCWKDIDFINKKGKEMAARYGLKQQYSTHQMMSGRGGICCVQEPPDGCNIECQNHLEVNKTIKSCHQSTDGRFLTFFDFGLDKEAIKKICYAEKELAKKHKIYRQKYCGCAYAVQNQA